jgi:hypothetical protein
MDDGCDINMASLPVKQPGKFVGPVSLEINFFNIADRVAG